MRKTKSSSPVPVVRGAAAAAAAAAALRPRGCGRPHVFLVAGMHHLAHAAGAVAEDRLGHVALGQRDVGAFLDVADAAVAHRLAHRVADLVAVAAQEALAVADRLVLARQAPVDDLVEHGPLRLWQSEDDTVAPTP